MSNGKKSSTTNQSSETPTAKGQQSTAEGHAEQVINREQGQGFRGIEVDPTPNENYTVAGVTSGAPTPETDVNTAKEAREVTGLGLTGLEAQERDRAAEAASKSIVEANRSKK